MSADTIVPGYANPQNLNRFSYVNNNPLRYIDPTGHMLDDGCSTGCGYTPPPATNYCTTHPGSCGGGGSGGGTTTPTTTPTRTPTPTTTPTASVTPTATITPACSNPSNLCTTVVAGQATTGAFQTPTPTGTATPAGTITPLAYNAVQTVSSFCFGGPDLSGASGCGELLDLGLQVAGQYMGYPAQDIPQPGHNIDAISDGSYVLGDLVETLNNEPPMSQQQAQIGLGYTILAFFVYLPLLL